MTLVKLLLVRMTRSCPNDLRLDEIHNNFLDHGFSFVTVIQKKVSREVCFCSVLSQITNTQRSASSPPPRESRSVSNCFRSSARFDAFRNLGVFFRPHLGVDLICLILEESNHLGLTLTDARLPIITRQSSLTSQPIWLKLTSLMTVSIANTNTFPVSESTSAPSTSLAVRTCSTRCLGCRPSSPCLSFFHCLCCCLRPCFCINPCRCLPLRVPLPLPVSLPLPLPLSWLMWSTSIGCDSFVSFLKSFAIQLLFEFKYASMIARNLQLLSNRREFTVGASRSTTLFVTSSSNFDVDKFSQTSTWCSQAIHAPSNVAGLSPIPSGAFSATNCLQTSKPFRFGTRSTNLKCLHHLHIPHFVDGQQTTTNTFNAHGRCQSKCFVTMAS